MAESGNYWTRRRDYGGLEVIGRTLDEIARRFAEYFAQWSIELPEASIATRSQGEIRKAGWFVQ